MNFPAYDETQDYFYTASQFEKEANKEFDIEIMHQIDKRLGKTQYHMGAHEGEIFSVEEKGFDLTEDKRNRFWYDWVIAIMKRQARRRRVDIKEMNNLMKKVNVVPDAEPIWAFITVGFDDEKIMENEPKFLKSVAKLAYCISHLTYEKGAIASVTYVIEKHRLTGIHHHIHFLFTFYTKVPPSTMINKIFSASGLKEYCTRKNFIDYIGPQKPNKERPHAPYSVYLDYVNGNKKEEKQKFVQLDRAWREKNGLCHLYSI